MKYQTTPATETDSARQRALIVLDQCSAVVPAAGSLKEADFSDSGDEDETQITLPIFVQKLKALIDDPAVDSAVWSPDGETIMIADPSRLAVQLCKYFKKSKLNSFVRQLHFYGFKKTGGKRHSDWVYSHKHFQVDGRMIHKVRRKTCGPDRQIQSLNLKVEGLQASLADTQRKLGDMASALTALLKEQQQKPRPSLGGGGGGGGGAKSSKTPMLLTDGWVGDDGGGGGDGGFESDDGPVRCKRAHPTNPPHAFDHFAIPKRPRGFLAFDGPFTQFEMLSPGLLSPRQAYYDDGEGIDLSLAALDMAATPTDPQRAPTKQAKIKREGEPSA